MNGEADETDAERAARKRREKAEIDTTIERERAAQDRKARYLERATRRVDAEIEAQIDVEALERGVSPAEYREHRLPVLSKDRDQRIHELWSHLLETEE